MSAGSFFAALALLVAFILMAIPAVVFMALNLLIANVKYTHDALRAMDKWLAATLGWSGKYTISAECGASDCAFCDFICKLLDYFDPGHCEASAKRERLIP